MNSPVSGAPSKELELYESGYFAYYKPGVSDPTWERPEKRTVIILDSGAATRASLLRAKLSRQLRGRSILIAYNRRCTDVLDALMDERIKPGTWLGPSARRMYNQFAIEGSLVTSEAYENDVLLAALLCVSIGSVIAIETILTIAPDVSKLCIYDLILDGIALGLHAVDCQSPHHRCHPLSRLGETTVTCDEYLAIIGETAGREHLFRHRSLNQIHSCRPA